MSKDEVVEKPDGLLDHYRCWWTLGDGTMAGYGVIDA